MQVLAALGIMSSMVSAAKLSFGDPADHITNATAASYVAFTRLADHTTGPVTFTDAADPQLRTKTTALSLGTSDPGGSEPTATGNAVLLAIRNTLTSRLSVNAADPGLADYTNGSVTLNDAADLQVALNLASDSTYLVYLSTLTDGAITSLRTTTDPSNSGTTANGNAVSLDTDNRLKPSLSVNAMNPADVTFTVAGLESGYSGTVTFTDSTGKSDVAAIGGNGTYSANPSNLANGTLTYLLPVSDPAGNVINIDPTTTLGGYNDGANNAPIGTPQFPNLLSGYAVRPPWQVAGVDYAVGIPSGTTLQDWETISQPGVSVNIASHTVVVTGNNVTLNGIDFSLHGGAQLVIYGSNDTVLNSNFLYGTGLATSSSIALIGGNGSNVTIKNCVLDGNGPTLGSNAANQTSLISNSFTGTTTINYNLLENFNQHVVEMNAWGTIVYEYNLIYNGGSGATGQHLNYLQFGAGKFSARVEFNTTYQPTNPISGGEGFQLYNNGTGSVNATLAYNTMIYSPKGDGRVHVADTGGYGGTTTASIHDNYINPGTGTFFYHDPTAGTSDTYYGDVDMVNGALIDAPGAPVIVSDTINGNVVTLNGTANANVTINVYDGTTLLGTTIANSSGAWTYTTGSLSIGTHVVTAKARDVPLQSGLGGNTSAPSAPVALTIGSVTAPSTAEHAIDSTIVRAHQHAAGVKGGIKIRKRSAARAAASRLKSISARTPRATR